jgi:hypothetical protein
MYSTPETPNKYHFNIDSHAKIDNKNRQIDAEEGKVSRYFA